MNRPATDVGEPGLGGVSPEPVYVRQSGDELTDEQSYQWFRDAWREAQREGCTHWRMSGHPDIPNLRLFEGWIERPDEEGDQRWALTSTPLAPAPEAQRAQKETGG